MEKIIHFWCLIQHFTTWLWMPILIFLAKDIVISSGFSSL